MTGRVPGLSPYWQDYFVCLLFHMLLPLMPLTLEYAFTAGIRPSTAHLTASLYAISLGASSRNKLLFALGVMVGFFFAASFGQTVAAELQVGPAPGVLVYPLAAIVFIFMVHAFERYNRHVVDRTPYWDFRP